MATTLTSLLGALAEVLLVNLVLSGDNAVVIGLAARSLPPEARRRAVVMGGGFAVALRLLLTVPAEFLLKIPFLRAGGGMLLIWVAYRLLASEEEAAVDARAATVIAAVKMIVLADLTMSLDNILAVAAVAERSAHPVAVLVAGLALSIPIVLLGGNIVARLMGRLPILVWVGAAILGYTAGELITEDKALAFAFEDRTLLKIAISTLVALVVIGLALMRNRGQGEVGHAPGDRLETTASG
jgi:YjbE family integral membrane protein